MTTEADHTTKIARCYLKESETINNAWMIPAGLEESRFLSLSVSGKRVGDTQKDRG